MAYLGHIIFASGVAMDPDQVTAMTSWPLPRNLIELRGFLVSMVTIESLLDMLTQETINRPTQKGCLLWTQLATTACEHLKEAMTRALVLIIPNFSKPFILEKELMAIVWRCFVAGGTSYCFI